ncbi:MAG: ferritin-like domain-containing protein [Akkermansiaceae bacterium]
MTKKDREKIIDLLQTIYSAEIETIENYLAWSINLDGLGAQRVKDILEQDISEELGHARILAKRIYVLGGVVPGSMQLHKNQRYLQPSQTESSLQHVVKGVVLAEESAIQHYRLLVEMTEGVDLPTQDIAVQLLAEEEMHRRQFAGILAEMNASDPSIKEKNCTLTY